MEIINKIFKILTIFIMTLLKFFIITFIWLIPLPIVVFLTIKNICEGNFNTMNKYFDFYMELLLKYY